MSVLSEGEIDLIFALEKATVRSFAREVEQATINKVVEMIDGYPCRNDKEYKWLLDSIQNELIGKQD